MCIKALDDVSPCCGAGIERVYYRFDSMRSCRPDDADWAEWVCVECGKKVEGEERNTCLDCKGSGEVMFFYEAGGFWTDPMGCSACRGTGRTLPDAPSECGKEVAKEERDDD